MAAHTLARDVSKKTGAERRRSPRKPHVIEAWIASPTATPDEERLEATSINLSRHGVAFCIKTQLPVGSYYVIEIGMGEQRMVSEVRTVSCRPGDDGMFEVGAAFV